MFEDDFPFPKVGYVSSQEGTSNPVSNLWRGCNPSWWSQQKKTGLAAQGGLDGGVGFVDDFGDEFRILQGLRRSKSTLFDMVTMLAEKCMVSKKKWSTSRYIPPFYAGPLFSDSSD